MKNELNDTAMEMNNHWHPQEFPTGLINPATGKEWVLSGYYEDEAGNEHFTHEEAMEIWESVPGWGPCTDEFHKALAEAVFDADKWEWRENVLGSGLNGFEYLTQRLGYKLGGYRDYGYGPLYAVGFSGFSWSTSVPAGSAYAHHMAFDATVVIPQYSSNRAYGFPVRCLQE